MSINRTTQINKEDYVIGVSKGGTGGITAADGSQTLGLLTRASLGTPLGAAVLGPDNKILPNSLPPITSVSTDNLTGPTTLTKNQVGTYTIVDYGIFKSYNLVAISGAVSISGATITYTAPNVIGSAGFIINGRNISVTITGAGITQPSILSPVAGSTGLSSSVTATSSVFSVTGATDTIASVDWQLSTDPLFGTVLQSVTASTTQLNTWTVSGLIKNLTYYIRTRQHGTTLGYSAWSVPSGFTTKPSFIPSIEYAAVPLQQTASGPFIALSGDASRFVVVTSTSVLVYVASVGYWTLEATLTSAGHAIGFNYHNYYNLVDINSDGSRLICTTTTGTSVYSRVGSTWSLEFTVPITTATSATINSDGSRIVVGNTEYISPSTGVICGCVYVYSRTNLVWTLEATLYPITPTTMEGFGGICSISDSGDRILVADMFTYARATADLGSSPPLVTIFTRVGTSWNVETVITVPQGSTYSTSASISGDGYSFLMGGVLYRRSGIVWSYSNTFITDTTYAMNVNGSLVVSNSGYIYSYSGGGWTQQPSLAPSGQPTISSDGSLVAFLQPTSGYSNVLIYI